MCDTLTKRITVGVIRSVLPVLYIVFFAGFISRHTSDEASQLDIFRRFFLVASNVTFLLIPIYCIVLTITNKLKWFALLPEIFFSLMTCFWSTIYHMCDAGPETTKMCAMDWQNMYYLDFIFSFQIIHLVFVYSPHFNMVAFTLKCIYLTIMLIANVIYVKTYYNGPFDKYFYLLHVICGVVTFIGRLLYLWFTDSFSHEMKYHFDYRIGIPAFICAVIGAGFKIGTPDDFTDYWWGHSLWHIFIGLAIYFAFAMYDITGFLWCIPKKPCPECDNDSEVITYQDSPV
jgi:hypothetical protein